MGKKLSFTGWVFGFWEGFGILKKTKKNLKKLSKKFGCLVECFVPLQPRKTGTKKQRNSGCRKFWPEVAGTATIEKFIDR
jgi:hypothetical protein